MPNLKMKLELVFEDTRIPLTGNSKEPFWWLYQYLQENIPPAGIKTQNEPFKKTTFRLSLPTVCNLWNTLDRSWTKRTWNYEQPEELVRKYNNGEWVPAIGTDAFWNEVFFMSRYAFMMKMLRGFVSSFAEYKYLLEISFFEEQTLEELDVYDEDDEEDEDEDND